MALLDAEAATGEDTAHICGLRRLVNGRYDAYVTRWRPINRSIYRRTGQVDQVTGTDRLARVAPPQGRFRLDPISGRAFRVGWGTDPGLPRWARQRRPARLGP